MYEGRPSRSTGDPILFLLFGRNLLTSKDIDALKDQKSVTVHKIYSVYSM